MAEQTIDHAYPLANLIEAPHCMVFSVLASSKVAGSYAISNSWHMLMLGGRSCIMYKAAGDYFACCAKNITGLVRSLSWSTYVTDLGSGIRLLTKQEKFHATPSF